VVDPPANGNGLAGIGPADGLAHNLTLWLDAYDEVLPGVGNEKEKYNIDVSMLYTNQIGIVCFIYL
jgi:hypothetical protein